MPFLIRIIAQRVIIAGIAFLTFLGVSPEANIPTEEQARLDTEERQRIIAQILSEQNTEAPGLPSPTRPTIVINGSIFNPDTGESTPLPTITSIPIKTQLPSLQPTPKESEVASETVKEQEPTIIPDTPPSTINNILVNIVCTQREANRISISTGSGTIISPNGVVLTNSHVAQLFLLEDYPREGYMDCSLRRENIPTYGFRAKPLYISKDWISENAHLINNPAPRGTGENDYALLVITENTNPVLSLPSSFPYATFNTTDGSADVRDSVTAAGYPGAQASLLNLNSSAKLLIDRTTITDVFTFARTTIDVFSTGVTPVAARGASGGGIFEDGELMGVIATTGANNTGTFINAITLSYINRDIRSETGQSLNSLISGDVKSKSELFMENEAPSLISKLANHL